MNDACAFCRPETAAEALWEGEHYRVLADAFPRCAGHVLLVTRAHLPSHMHAPREWMPEFAEAQRSICRFLRDTFGAATFYENGAKHQEVPHAHLHGLPFDPVIDPDWLRERKLERISGWEDARRECEREGHYFYLETGSGSYLIRKYKFVLRRVRSQLLDQTEATQDADTGKMARGGPDMIQQTARLWRAWQQAAPGNPD